MPDLSYLTIDHAPNKTTYLVGDRFERYGMVVKAHYSDGSSNTIDFYMCSPSVPLTINDSGFALVGKAAALFGQVGGGIQWWVGLL